MNSFCIWGGRRGDTWIGSSADRIHVRVMRRRYRRKSVVVNFTFDASKLALSLKEIGMALETLARAAIPASQAVRRARLAIRSMSEPSWSWPDVRAFPTRRSTVVVLKRDRLP